MKKYIFISISLFLPLMSCVQNDNPSEIILETTGFADSTKIYLTVVEDQFTDSGYIINNQLVFSADINEPTKFIIRPVIKSRADIDVRTFWKENRQLIIRAEKGNLKNASIEGSEIQLQADALDALKTRLLHVNDSLMQLYRSLLKEDVEKAQAVRAKGKEIAQAIKDVDINYVKNNPDEIYSVITLKELMSYKIPKDVTRALYENLSDEMKSTKDGTTIKKYLDVSRDLEIGDEAIGFQLPDLDGNLVGPDDFPGKYILLDFWGSGCGPCRMENPSLLRNYKAYREKGFEIISISFDRRKENWADAVEKDSMIWTTVCDLQGSNSEVIMTYKVYVMPTYFLINPEGVIIEKAVGRGGQIEKKLEEIFPSS